MNVVDSMFWLEYFADTEAGNIVVNIIENIDEARKVFMSSYSLRS
jgi:hypothetical protein